MRTLLAVAVSLAPMPRAIADPEPPTPADVPDTTPAPPPVEQAPPTAPVQTIPPSATPISMLPPPPPALPTEPIDRTSAYVATGIAGAALVGTLICFVKFNQASDRAGQSEPGRLGTDAQVKLMAAYDEADTWRTRALAMGGLTLVGAVVAGYFWGDTPPAKRTNVDFHPTAGGAGVSLSGRF